MIAKSNELRERPLARTVLNTPLVLFRTGTQIAALVDRCSHRNAPLSTGRVIDGAVQCPYHGWCFGPTGQCVRRPGTDPVMEQACDVPSFEVQELDGLIWCRLSSESKMASPVRTSWWGDSTFAHFTWSDHVEAGFIDGMENLLDATHTPFVHAGLIRSQRHAQTFQATVRIKPGMVEAEYHQEGKQAGWISQIFERDRQSSFGRFIPPCIAELEYTSSRGTEFVLNCHFTPETPQKTHVFSTFFVRRTHVPMGIKRALLTPFFRRVLKQDQAILKQQQQNIERFGTTDYHYWEGDLLRGHIETWFREGEFLQNHPEQSITLRL